jgi:hypothetical protein
MTMVAPRAQAVRMERQLHCLIALHSDVLLFRMQVIDAQLEGRVDQLAGPSTSPRLVEYDGAL